MNLTVVLQCRTLLIDNMEWNSDRPRWRPWPEEILIRVFPPTVVDGSVDTHSRHGNVGRMGDPTMSPYDVIPGMPFPG